MPGWIAAVAAGLLIVASLPPVGVWPLALVGVTVLDRAMADARMPARFGRCWLAGIVLLAPTTWWMRELTLPGWLLASLLLGALLGLALAATPPAAGQASPTTTSQAALGSSSMLRRASRVRTRNSGPISRPNRLSATATMSGSSSSTVLAEPGRLATSHRGKVNAPPPMCRASTPHAFIVASTPSAAGTALRATR